MDTATAKSTATIPNFKLSARQEQLLFAALNSNNKPNTIDTSILQSNTHYTMAPGSLTESPLQQAPGSGTLNGFEDSPFIDYDYEFDAEGSFDYDFSNDSQGQMIGKLPGTSSDGDADTHDKRSHPDDDGDDEEGGGKRREGDEKSSKKPGRKPLTSEPTSVSASMVALLIAIATDTLHRSARLRIVLLNEHSASGRKSTSRILRPRLTTLRRPRNQQITKIVYFVHK
jgi:AP-1-like transcription factor